MEMSDRSFLTLSVAELLGLLWEGWEAGRAQGWTILWEERGREGARATGSTRATGGATEAGELTLFRDSRAWAVVEVLGDTGPFSWFSVQPPL